MKYYLAWWFICIPFGHAMQLPQDEMAPWCPRCDRYWGMDENDLERADLFRERH